MTRAYYSEGELVPGTPAQPYYYGPDQVGSVRRAFASTSSAPAFSYDPYGNPLQPTMPVTDFGYAGMFYNSDSGLYLTRYRAYDPVPGRWLSRDPIGESSDPVANIYAYVGGEPLGSIDLLGLGSALTNAMSWACSGCHSLPAPPSPSNMCTLPPGFNGMLNTAPDQNPPEEEDESPPLPKPAGIPDNWTETPSAKGGGTVYTNPDDPNDLVRVMPGNPDSPYPSQQVPYVVDQNGSFLDVNGNPIPGANPGQTPQAHIPYSSYTFKR